MTKIVRTTAAILSATMLATVGMASLASAATPATTVTVHPADLIAGLSDTRAAGHVTFLNDGIRVKTDEATSAGKAAEYFALTGHIPTSATLDWIGTDTQPGAQIVFDADGTSGNGNDWNILVGEKVYGDNWWLTNGSSAVAKAADPSGDNNGGNGSAYFGTLADWNNALPEARVYAGGFSLGSGAKGDGVIPEMTFGDTTYHFAKAAPVAEAPAVANVKARATVALKPRGIRIDMTSAAQPANTVLGNKVEWVIKVDGVTAFKTRQAFNDHDTFIRAFAKDSGKHTIKIFKNGVQVRYAAIRA